MSDFVHFKFETLFQRLLGTQVKWGLLFLTAFLSGCTFQARLLPTEQEVISSLKILNDSGPVSEANKSSYHIRGLCPAESSTVQFQSSSSTLTCNAGVFEGDIDLSSHPDGSLDVLIFTDNGHANNWRVIKDTVPPIVNIGTPIYTHTGLNRSISIPITLTDANAISFSSGLVDLSGTGVNGCLASLQGTGLTARQLVISNCSHSSGTLSVKVLAGLIADEAGNSSLDSNTISGITIDNVAPTISESLTSSASGTSATTFEWDLQFTGADLVEMSTGDIALSGATTGCTVQLTGTGLTQRTLQIAGCSGNGTLQIALPAALAKDLANNPSASLSLTSVTIDNLGPSLALQSPTPISGNSGTTFNWVLDIAGANAVTLTASDVTLTGTTAGCSTSIGGSGLAQRTISVSGCTGSGSLGITVAAGIASDSAGNLSSAITSSGSVTIVNTALTLSISSPSTSAINSSNQTQFTLTYGNATNYTLTTSDIALNGANTGCTKGITGSGPTFTLTIANCSGNGNLSVSVVSGTANDGSGNFSPAAGPSANVVVDNIKPTFTISGPTPTTGNSSTSFDWTLTFSGADSIPLDNSFLTITGTNTGCTTSVSGAGTTRTITMTGCSGNGSADIAVNDGAGTDTAGNASNSVASLGAVTIDNTRPTLSIGAPTPTSGNSASTFVWPITYTGANTITLSSGDVSLTTSLTGCTVAVATTSANTREVRITSCTGDGTLTFSLAASTASDSAGNTTLAAGPATSVTVDNVVPVLSIGSPTPLAGNSTSTFTWPLTFTGADFANLTTGSVDLIGATTGCSVNVTSSGVSSGTVEVSGCTGTGTLAIQIDAGVLTDFVGNSSTQTAASATVSINNAAPVIYVSGLPVGNNDVDSATSTTSGSNLVSYTFKIGPTATTDCSINADYSSPLSLGNYNHDFTSLPEESITACFKGLDTFGTMSNIFEHRWFNGAGGGGGVSPDDYINICGQPPSSTYSASTSNTSGIIVDSGGHNSQYQNGENCTYTITTGAPITVNFISFQSESGWDFLKVYDGTQSGTLLIDRSGNGTGATYTANSGTMTLKWTSDGSVTQDGFVISWGGAAPSSGADPSPAPFAFNNVVNGLTNTVYSKTTTITGISQAVFAGVSGFDAQIRNTSTGSAWATWVMVNDGDSIEVRMTSGATNSENRAAQIQVGTFATTWSIYWDSVAPTGSISIAGGAANSLSLLTSLNLTMNDADSLGTNQMYLTQDPSCTSGGSWQDFDSNPSWTLAYQNALNTVYVRYKDEAGNISACYNDSITQDDELDPVPIVVDSTTYTNNPIMTLGIHFTEPVTGLTLSDFIVTNATVSNLSGSGKYYSVTLTASTLGAFSIEVPAGAVQDAFGNSNSMTDSGNYIYDNVAPGVTLSSASSTTQSAFEITATVNDTSVSSISTFDFAITNGTIASSGVTTVGANKLFTFMVTPTSAGNVSIYIPAGEFTDAAGNSNTISNTLNVLYAIPPTIQFAETFAVIDEGNGTSNISARVTLNPAPQTNIDVRVFATPSSTAIAGADYNLPTTNFTINSGSTYFDIPVEIVGNAITNEQKVLALGLTAENGDIIFSKKITHTILITDDESPLPAPTQIQSDSVGVMKLVGGKLWTIGNSLAFANGASSTFTQLDPSNDYIQFSYGSNSYCGVTTGNQLRCAGYWATSASGATNYGMVMTQDSGVSYKWVYTFDYNAAVCGITTADKIRCRGPNENDVFGIGGADFSNNFVDVDAGRDYKKVYPMDGGTICGITTADQLYCWGNNTYGQVGNGSTSIVTTPTLIDSGTTYKQLYTVFSTSYCGITSTDQVKCWGWNNGRFGLPAAGTNILTPTLIDSGRTYKSLAFSGTGSCGLRPSGQLRCWSYTNGFYSKNLDMTLNETASDVLVGKSFSDLFGFGNICLLDASNTLLCDQYYQHFANPPSSPTVISFQDEWEKIETGYSINCGLKSSGIVKCSNRLSDIERSHYIPVNGYNNFTDISVADGTACAIGANDKLYCWGEHTPWRIFKSGTTWAKFLDPVLVTFAPGDLKDVEVSYNSVCVLKNDGTMLCSGRNLNGSFGVGDTNEKQEMFVSPNTSSKFTKMTVIDSTICGITTTQALECWGARTGTASSSTVPITVMPGTQFIDVSSNSVATCAVTAAGELYCWGMDDGSLATGTSTYATVQTPQLVDSTSNFATVKLLNGQYGGCGLTAASQLKCWGSNLSSLSITSQSPTLYDSGIGISYFFGDTNMLTYRTTGGVWKTTKGNPTAKGLSTPLLGLSPIQQ